MADETLSRDLDRMLNPPKAPSATPQQQGTSGLPQMAPTQQTPSLPQQPGAGAANAAPAGRPPAATPSVGVTPDFSKGQVAPEITPEVPEASQEAAPSTQATQAKPVSSVDQAAEAALAQAKPATLPAEVPSMGPMKFDYMPSEDELAGIPPDTSIETPDGTVYTDKATGQRKLRLNAAGFKRAKARAIRDFGRNPFADIPGMPAPDAIIQRGIQGKRMFNPFEKIDFKSWAPDIGGL